MNREPIAVVGISSVFPGADNTAQFWDTIFNARDRISEVPEHYWLTQDYFSEDPRANGKTYCKRGGFLSGQIFDPELFRLPPNTLSSIDTVQLLALICARRLVDNCPSLQNGKTDRKNVSVILGGASATEMMTAMMGHLTRPNWRNAMREEGLPEPLVKRICEKAGQSFSAWTENSFPGSLGNITAGRIANRLDLGGTNCVVDAACASSLAAVHTAIQSLRTGASDMVITGGADAHNDSFMFVCFSKTPALSRTGDCRPFSEKADGTILGEGVGLLALKRLSDAQRDEDPIYGVIRGSGTSSDGMGKSIYAPQPKGQVLAIERAYNDAGANFSDTELIEAHGTATRANDAAEFSALCKAFAPASREANHPVQWCGLGSVKSQIGHTKAAAGAASLIKMVLALHHKILPPTIKADAPNPDLAFDTSPFYLNTLARPWIHAPESRRQGSLSAFGFGGSNAHLVVQEYRPRKQINAPAPRYPLFDTVLLMISAKDDRGLAREIQALETRLEAGQALGTLARETQQGFDSHAELRLTLTVSSHDRALTLLAKAKEKLTLDHRTAFSISDRLHFGCGPCPGKIAFLFPGQGSQYPYMGADLAMAFPKARKVWDEEASAAQKNNHIPIHTKVFPAPGFGDDKKAAIEEALSDTAVAQPAIGITSLSMLALLNQAGIRPDCVAGHSYGELPALFCAGAISSEADLLSLSKARGSLMAAVSDPATPTGMTAVMASRKIIDAILERLSSDLIIANENSPSQLVLSGPCRDLDRLEEHLKQDRIRFHRLKVSMAFHSQAVSGLSRNFLTPLEAAAINRPAIPVYSNADGEPYPETAEKIRIRLAEQIALPVRFLDQVKAMHRDGVRLFIEVGPGRALTGLVSRCLEGKPFHAAAIDASGSGETIGFWNLVARLGAAGVCADLSSFWTDIAAAPVPPKVSASAVEIFGSNYNKPYPPKGGASALPEPVLHDAAAQVFTPGKDESDIRTLYARMKQAQETFLKASTDFMDRMGDPAASTMPLPDAPLPSSPGHQVSPAQQKAPDAGVQDPAAYQKTLFEILAEQTGYPEDLFDMETELEAGYGIDSIKKVEILAAFQDRHPELDLGDIQALYSLLTIGDIVSHIAMVAGTKDAQTKTAKAAPRPTGLEASFPNGLHPVPATAEVTQAPSPVMRYALRLEEAPFPKDTPEPPVRDWTLIQDNAGVAPLLASALEAAGSTVSLTDHCPDNAAHVVFLKGLDRTCDISQAMAMNAKAFETAKACAAVMTESGGDFILVQDTGGDFNLSGSAGARAWGGGLSALAKTAAKEWPKARVKSLDIADAALSPKETADRILKELCVDDGPLEIGLGKGRPRVTPVLEAASELKDSAPLPPNPVVVVSGGAKGITRACICALVAESPMKVAILGRTPAEGDDSGRIQEAIAALEQSGAKALYFCADVTDREAVEAALDDVRALFGPVDVLIHGAGINRDGLIREKDIATFTRVFETKVNGFYNLLEETRNDPIQRILVFSSIVAREGNFRQADYAMANEVLNKVCQSEAVIRQASCRVRAVNWGPWDGGMVEDHHKTVFRTMGIPLINPAQGAQAFVREIFDPGTGAVEIVIGGVRPDRKEGNQGSMNWKLNLEDHPWVKDHSPSLCIPVLPMTVELDLLCTQGADCLGGLKPVEVRSLTASQWAAFHSDCLEGRTLIQDQTDYLPDTGHLLDMALQVRDGDGFSKTASATIRFDQAYPKAPEQEIPPLEKGSPAPCPYETGRLFHGPAFHLAEDITLGANGADLTVQCVSKGVPYGTVHPGLFDAALHCIDADSILRWFPETGDRGIPFPLSLKDLILYRDLPTEGRVRVLARAAELVSRYFPLVKFWIFDDGHLAATFTLKLALVPKGPLARFKPEAMKRFMTRTGHVQDLNLGADMTDDSRRTRIEDLRAMDFLPGTLASVFNIKAPVLSLAPAFYEAVALKAHAADLTGIHPSRICLDASGNCLNLPLNRMAMTAKTQGADIITRHTGIAPLDHPDLNAFWYDTQGLSHTFMSDLFEGFLRKFIRRLMVEDPGQIPELAGRPMVFLSNHQTGVETPLLAILLTYLFKISFYGITNKEQQTGMLGSLNRLVQAFAGTKLPIHMRVFDQEKRLELPKILQEIMDQPPGDAACPYLACEGRRAFRAGYPIARVSSAIIDFSIEHGLPIVPIRLTGGLPKQGPDQYQDYPCGFGGQDIYIGRAILPSTLAALPYGNRPRLILDRINTLGPELEAEAPIGPDKAFLERVNALSSTLKLPEPACAALACLGLVKSPCQETNDFMSGLEKGVLKPPEPDSALQGILSLLSDN